MIRSDVIMAVRYEELTAYRNGAVGGSTPQRPVWCHLVIHADHVVQSAWILF